MKFTLFDGWIGNYTLNGGNGNDFLYSFGSGNYTLNGGHGNDILFGGIGNDTLNGGSGNDGLYGGIGNDTAVFSGSANDYAFRWLPGGILQVSGKDGVDTLSGVEVLQFGTKTYSINGPIARSDRGSGTENQTIKVSNILANDVSLKPGAALRVQKLGGGNAVIGDTVAIVDGIKVKLGANNSLEINPGATWDFLSAGQTITRIFDYKVGNGSGFTTAPVTITITGTNDAAVVGGAYTGKVTEAGGVNNATPGSHTTSGKLIIADADKGQAHFQTPASLAGTYGKFTFNAATGTWGYALNNAAANVQALSAGAVVHDKLTVKSADGTVTKTIVVTINGANDAAVITGTATGSVIEASGDLNGTAGTSPATGDLNATDVDNPATFNAQTGVAKSYGTFSINANGTWSYTLDDTNAAVQALNTSSTPLHELVTVTTADGTTKVIDITINGANDAAVITVNGVEDTSVTEKSGVANGTAGDATASGDLNATDVDNPATFNAQTGVAKSYGTFSINANGTWSYTLDDTNAAVQALNSTGANTTLHELVTVTTADGTAKVIDITINGANDAAVITVNGVEDTSVTEKSGVANGTAGDATASGDLNATDVDNPATFNAQTGVAKSYGTFSIDANGTWSYTLDDTNAAVQALNSTGANTTLHELVTVTTADGTQKVIDISINGANDAPVVGSVGNVGTISEDAAIVLGDVDGAVTVTDPDDTTMTWQLVDISVGGVLQGAAAAASLGISWNPDGSYSFDPNAFNSLDTGETRLIEVSYRAYDGEAYSNVGKVSFTVTGANDAPVVGSVGNVGTISEDAAIVLGDVDGAVTVTDPDDTTMTWQLVDISVGGVLQGAAAAASLGISWNPDGSYSFDPNAFNSLDAGETRLIEVSYRAYDGEAYSNVGKVSFTVTGANDAPVVGSVGNVGTISEDAAIVLGDVDGAVTVTDPDDTTMTWQLVDISVGGVLQGAAAAASLGISWNPDGSYSFDPNAFNSLDTGETRLIEVSYRAYDGEAYSNVGKVSFTVTGANDAPVVGSVGNVGTISEDAAIVLGDVDGAVTVTDPDDTTMTWQLVDISVGGVLQGAAAAASLGISWNPDGSYSFDPNAFNSLDAGETRLIEVSYRAYDGEAYSNVGKVSFTVTGANDAPVVGSVGNVGTISEDAAIVLGDVDGAVTVTDPDDTTMTWQLVDISVGGVLQGAAAAASLGISWNPDGSYSFDPNAFNSLDTGETRLIEVSYRAYDGEAYSNVGKVSFTVTGANDAPVVGSVGNVGTISEDAAIVLGDVDGAVTVTDPDDTTMTWQLVDISVGGVLQGAAAAASLGISWNPDGSYSFDPNAFNSLDAGETRLIEVSYRAYDGEAYSNVGKVSFTVTGANDAPVVGSVGNVGTISEDAAIVLGDVDGAVTVTDPDDTTMTWQLVDISVGGVLQGAAAAASLGISWNPDGSYSFDPNAFNSLDTGETRLIEVSYRAYDGEAYSNVGKVSFTVTGANDAPALTGDRSATVAEGGIYAITTTDLNFTDADDNAAGVTFTVSNLVNGTVKVNGVAQTTFTGTQLAAGQVTFTHDGSETTAASFQVSVEDGNEDSSAATASAFNFAVTPVNDAPALTGDRSATVAEGGIYAITTTDLNFTDADDNAAGVTFTVSNLVNGTVKVNGVAQTTFTGTQLAAGQVTFTHDGSETTAASFQVSVEDGNEDSSAATASAFNFAVTPVNDAPALTGDRSATVAEGGIYAITTTDLNFTDADDNAAGVTFTVSNLVNGTVKVNGVAQTTFTGTQLAAGQVTFTHDGSETTAASFQVSVEDGNEDSSAATASAFNFAVTPVNDAPFDIKWNAAAWTDGNDLPGADDDDVVIANLVASDHDNANGFTYSLVSATYGSGTTTDYFNVSATGEVTRLDREMLEGTTYTLKVSAKDGGNAVYEETFNIITGTSSGNGTTGNPMGNDTGDDILYGLGNNDVIYGNSGDDSLYGQDGDDTLVGGDGGDVLFGGAGNDNLTGGAGADKFWFDTAPHQTQNMDTITDFTVGVDKIVLDNSVFTAVGADGALAAAAFVSVTDSSAVDGNERIVYDSDSGRLYYDSNGSNGGGSTQMAQLQAGLSLSASDFLIV